GSAIEQQVASKFSLPQDVLLVVDHADAIEPLLQTGERLQRALATDMPGLLAGGIGFMLPSDRTQNAVAKALQESGVTAESARHQLDIAAKGAGFRADSFVPFVERLPRLLDPAERITYDGLVSHGLDPFVSRFLVKRGATYEAVTYIYPDKNLDIAALS